jgi:hypothetical protein
VTSAKRQQRRDPRTVLAPAIAIALAVSTLVATPGCAAQRRSPRIDFAAFRTAVTKSTGIKLFRDPDNPQAAEILGLDAGYTALTTTERLVVLEFVNSALTRQVLGSQAELRGATVLRRSNVVVFYVRRPGSISHAHEIQQELRNAPVRE